MSDYIKIQVMQEDADWCSIQMTNLDTGATGFDNWLKNKNGTLTWHCGSMYNSLVQKVGVEKAMRHTEHALARRRKYIIIEA